jgi:hypothetical protein
LFRHSGAGRRGRPLHDLDECCHVKVDHCAGETPTNVFPRWLRTDSATTGTQTPVRQSLTKETGFDPPRAYLKCTEVLDVSVSPSLTGTSVKRAKCRQAVASPGVQGKKRAYKWQFILLVTHRKVWLGVVGCYGWVWLGVMVRCGRVWLGVVGCGCVWLCVAGGTSLASDPILLHSKSLQW